MATQTLYETDYLAWLQSQIEALQQGQELDRENLIEELELMGSEVRHAVESYLEQLLIHILKVYCVQDPYCLPHWQREIRSFCKQLNKRLSAKTLRNYAEAYLEQAFDDALKEVKENYPQANFPLNCPWSLDDLLELGSDWSLIWQQQKPKPRPR